jgi:hypothetical protein
MSKYSLLSVLFLNSFQAISGAACSSISSECVVPGAASEFTPLVPQREPQNNTEAPAAERAADYMAQYGVFAYGDGRIYVGYHQNNRPHGHGAIIDQSANTVWIGNFVRGLQVTEEFTAVLGYTPRSRTITLPAHHLMANYGIRFPESSFGLRLSQPSLSLHNPVEFIDIGIFQNDLLEGHGVRIIISHGIVRITTQHFSRGELAQQQNRQTQS